jgi:hypothetical protein
MKKYSFLLLLVVLFVVTACSDKSAPTFTSLKINGADVNIAGASYIGGINETVTLDWVVADDKELFQFITFIDTTGLDDRERLQAKGLSTKEDFIRVELRMKALDSLSDLYFFGNPLPVNFTIIDDAQNKTNTVINFTAN